MSGLYHLLNSYYIHIDVDEYTIFVPQSIFEGYDAPLLLKGQDTKLGSIESTTIQDTIMKLMDNINSQISHSYLKQFFVTETTADVLIESAIVTVNLEAKLLSNELLLWRELISVPQHADVHSIKVSHDHRNNTTKLEYIELVCDPKHSLSEIKDQVGKSLQIGENKVRVIEASTNNLEKIHSETAVSERIDLLSHTKLPMWNHLATTIQFTCKDNGIQVILEDKHRSK